MSEQFQIIDRADGVKGHCCVGREVASVHGTYWEFWTGLGWSGAGKVYSREEAGQVIWALESIAKVTAERDAARAELAWLRSEFTEAAQMVDDGWKISGQSIREIAESKPDTQAAANRDAAKDESDER